MKTKAIKTKYVYSAENQNTVYCKKKNNDWFPINFQWIPVIKLNNELNKKTNKMKNKELLLTKSYYQFCSHYVKGIQVFYNER